MVVCRTPAGIIIATPAEGSQLQVLRCIWAWRMSSVPCPCCAQGQSQRRAGLLRPRRPSCHHHWHPLRHEDGRQGAEPYDMSACSSPQKALPDGETSLWKASLCCCVQAGMHATRASTFQNAIHTPCPPDTPICAVRLALSVKPAARAWSLSPSPRWGCPAGLNKHKARARTPSNQHAGRAT